MKPEELQAVKQVVMKFYGLLDTQDTASMYEAFSRFTVPDLVWRGYHPFGNMGSGEEVLEKFWKPFKRSFFRMQRRMDIFFAGRNQMDDFKSVWVVSMGHLMGLFDKPWLGIQPTSKMAFLRYCEFHKVENGRIVETAMYFDIPHLMTQAGFDPFPQQTAITLVQPGPKTHDGLLFDGQPRTEGEKTLLLINKMIGELGRWQSGLSLEEELRQSWHDDMIWWGPTGIGATYTIERYAKQHAAPFRAAFSDRSATGHIARLAEGNYGGFFGWPNFSATLSGDFMGHEATNKTGEFRVIDIYRREGEKLAENWVFIDLPFFWKQQGFDVVPTS